MRFLDLYPAQGCFAPNQAIRFDAEIEAGSAVPAVLEVRIQHLADPPVKISLSLELMPGVQRIPITWEASGAAPAGYGVKAVLIDASKETCLERTTAFDVLSHWKDFPRYGFLTDFFPGRQDISETIDELCRYHLNGLQFYDWQYHHDRLLAPDEVYKDPLGRSLSLATIQGFIESARKHGMAAMAYLAVYAASLAFWRAHPDWALYDRNGHPIPFGEDFLGLMDPSPGRPWAEHLLGECQRVLAALRFDGLHIDQYGEPHQAWDANAKPVDLPGAFAQFAHAAKDSTGGKTVVFNAVGNWPIEALAASAVDFLYIEVWPPQVRYSDLIEVIQNARAFSNGKPVVIALYLPADWPANILLVNALVFACGAARIELGERERWLADPYFPKHQALGRFLHDSLRRNYDFAVRYGEWTGPGGVDLEDAGVRIDGEVWCLARGKDNWLVINLVNHTGLSADQRWDEAHPGPQVCKDLRMRLPLAKEPRRVLWACPERPEAGPGPIPFDYHNGWLSLRLPALKMWGMVVIEHERGSE